MAKEASLRLILDSLNAAGESPEKTLDETLDLSGYKSITPGQRIALAAAASDEAVTFTDVIGLVVMSHDNPFSIRLAAGETLVANQRLFVIWANDEDTGAIQTSVLLTGNGVNEADIEVWKIEAP